jgi:hypothetical protein
MSAALEEKQEGITTELQAVAPKGASYGQKFTEHTVEGVGEVFRSYFAPSGQPFGERCETGDVGKDQAAIDLSPHPVRLGCEPGRMDLRQISQKIIHAAISTTDEPHS